MRGVRNGRIPQTNTGISPASTNSPDNAGKEVGKRAARQPVTREINIHVTPLVRADQLSDMSSVREKVITPATVSQQKPLLNSIHVQRSDTFVPPTCWVWRRKYGYEPMWQEPGQGGSTEPRDTPLYHPPIVS